MFNAKKLYMVLMGALGLALVILGLTVYAASSLLEKKAADVYTMRLYNLALEEKQRQLSKARSDIAKYRPLAEIARNVVPQDKDQAQTVREIVNIAAANGIKLGSITFPSSSLGDAKAPISQLVPVKAIPGVYSLSITVQSDSSAPSNFTDLTAFLNALEHNRRTALVSGISLQPDITKPGRLGFTLTINEYIKP